MFIVAFEVAGIERGTWISESVNPVVFVVTDVTVQDVALKFRIPNSID
jgi:hypothetical protein